MIEYNMKRMSNKKESGTHYIRQEGRENMSMEYVEYPARRPIKLYMVTKWKYLETAQTK